MLVLIAIVLALIPAIAILYPLVRGSERIGDTPDEGYTHVDVVRRWEAALAGLKSTELDWATGNLTSDDYSWLRERYMKEAALAMKVIESQEDHNRRPTSARCGRL